MNFKYTLTLLFVTSLLLVSCATPKDIAYFKGLDQMTQDSINSGVYKVSIEPDDNLLITVSAPNPASALAFNTSTNLAIAGTTSTNAVVPSTISASSTPSTFQGYLVNNEGYINFPIVGSVKLAGLTKQQAIDLLTEKVGKYIEKPVVNIRFLNYKITVLGEVAKPGTYVFTNERVSILNALGAAGGMTIYGKRTNVLVCRTVGDKREYAHLDMHSSNVLASNYYYLHQNDVIYVEPNDWKASTAKTYNPNMPIILSAITTLVAVVALGVTISRK